MSAGVADQRMKGQATPVSNVSKEQLESPGEELAESWRHQQPAAPYAPPITSATDPYSAAGYYGTGTGAFQYQAFGVGDGTWSTNGTDPMTFLGGYPQPDTYGMEGVFGPSTTPFSTTFGPTTSAAFNYFHGNGDYSTWGGPLGRVKQYDDYYRQEGHYVTDGLKAVDTGVQGLSLNDSKLEKDPKSQQHEQKDMSGQPKKTWATIASQPAKPQAPMPSSSLKKKGPGMPPPPIIPGKHNMDIGTWETAKNNGPVVSQPPSQPPPPKPQPVQQQTVVMPSQPPPGPPVVNQHPWAGTAPPRAPPPRPQPQLMLPPVPMSTLPPPPQLQAPSAAHPVLDKLRTKNNYNPPEFDLSARDARFFVIKSYSEDDIHRSIKYEIWCSTEHGNKRLDTAFRERTKDGAQGIVYLFFSVNGSGHFCGMAQMVSSVDYKSNSSVWAQDKWKGQFKVRWIYVKDVPNMQLRHIRLENNENKPVTNSRDTQEIPHAKGLQVIRLMHSYRHSTSIFDDFIHYEKRQEEEDMRKVPEPVQSAQPGGYKENQNPHSGGGPYEGGKHQNQGYEKHDSYGGGNKGHYNRDHGGGGGGGGFGRDHSGFPKDHGGQGGGFHKDIGFHKDHGNSGYNKDHGNNGEGYTGGYKGHNRGGDREQHGGSYREHRDQSGGGSGYRPHKERGEGSSRGRGRGRPN